MIYYADTSVLVKRYVTETGSAWVRALMRSSAGNTFFTAQISLVEIYSAFNRRLRKQTITPLRYVRLSALVNHIWASQYIIVMQTAPVFDEARQLVERRPLRAYDAVQLASAIQSRQTIPPGSTSMIFLSADRQLLTAAKAEGFATDNPNLH